MKRIVVLLMVLSLLVAAVPSYAAKGGTRGASASAYEHASDEAIFHRVGDWFATRGKSDTEKKAIIAERKAERVAKKAQKKAEKEKKRLQKEAEKTKKKMHKKLKGSKKGSR